MKDKIVYVVPEKIRIQSIETLEVKEDVKEYLRNKGLSTIEDVIQNQNNLPKEIVVPIRAKLMFGIDL